MRASISKGTMNALIGGMPDLMVQAAIQGEDKLPSTFTIKETNTTTETLFTTLVTAWSLPVEPTLENYFALDNEASLWVDKTLYEHFGSLSLSKEEQGKP